MTATATKPEWNHDPQAVRDYTWDWVNRLKTGQDITVATVTPSDGITATNVSIIGTKVTARIAVTTAPVGSLASAVCHIVTSSGEEDDWTFYFRILHR